MNPLTGWISKGSVGSGNSLSPSHVKVAPSWSRATCSPSLRDTLIGLSPFTRVKYLMIRTSLNCQDCENWLFARLIMKGSSQLSLQQDCPFKRFRGHSSCVSLQRQSSCHSSRSPPEYCFWKYPRVDPDSSKLTIWIWLRRTPITRGKTRSYDSHQSAERIPQTPYSPWKSCRCCDLCHPACRSRRWGSYPDIFSRWPDIGVVSLNGGCCPPSDNPGIGHRYSHYDYGLATPGYHIHPGRCPISPTTFRHQNAHQSHCRPDLFTLDYYRQCYCASRTHNRRSRYRWENISQHGGHGAVARYRVDAGRKRCCICFAFAATDSGVRICPGSDP